MAQMLAILFAITTLICARGWLCNRISMLTMVTYIAENSGALPTYEELKQCQKRAIKEMLHIK